MTSGTQLWVVTSDRREPMMAKSNRQLYVLRWVLLCVVLNASGQILFKAAGAAQSDASLLSAFFQVEAWGGFVIYGVSAVCWLWILSRVELSLAYPLLSLTFPIVVGLSAILFSESISSMGWTGVGVIVIGVSLLAKG